jgi:FAD/FMN-containing dehydrogenase
MIWPRLISEGCFNFAREGKEITMIAGNKLVKIVGAGKIDRAPATLEEYSRDMSFISGVKPVCVVRPGNEADVEALVKLANETLTPLVPVSSGPPHFRGDTVPGIGGAVIVDLSGMKKIIRVDRTNRVAMFEPGVTFNELIPAVAREGLRLNMPLLPRRSKSVVGSLLEREPVVMPKYHWDIGDPLACVEVVFGTGDMFRTGAAAGPGTLEEQWAAGGAQKEAAGPSAFSLYRVVQGAQGTMGIVTWASARCELIPGLEEPFLVGSSNLDKLMEMVHWLIRLRLVNECFVLNNTGLAAILAKKWPGDYREIKDTLPPWVLFFNIAGYEYLTEERVNGQVNDMKEIAQRVGLEPVRDIGEVSAYELLETVKRPSGEPYWKLRHKGACHDIFFLTIYDNLPGLLDTMYAEARQTGYPTSEIGIYLQPVVQGTNCHVEFNLFYDPQNRSETARVKELSDRVITGLMARGAFFSRPYGPGARTIINRDAATVSALKKVKSILDPNNIMNPGKLCF